MEAELTFDQLYADLVEAAHDEPPVNSFSAAQFAEDAKITHRQALTKLKALVDDGALCGDKFNVSGNRAWRFWFAEGDE